MLTRAILVFALCSCLGPILAAEQENACPAGSFEPGAGWPAVTGPCSIVNDGKNHWLRIVGDPSGGSATQMPVPLKPEWRMVVVSVRMKATGITVGKESWNNGRVALQFQDAANAMVGNWPAVPNLSGDCDWTEQEVMLEVPEKAHHLVVQPAMMNCSGVLEVDDLRVRGFRSAEEILTARCLPLGPERLLIQPDAQGRLAGWTLPDPAIFAVADGESGKALRMRAADPETNNCDAKVFVRLDPAWTQVGLQARMRASDCKAGNPKWWRQYRVDGTFVDVAGKDISWGPNFGLGQDTPWADQKSEMAVVPDGARFLRINVGPSHIAGTCDLAALKLLVVNENAAPADAAVPPGERTTWGEEPVEQLGARRASICLNGLWRFMPCSGPAEQAPLAQGWGLIRVPGSWKDANRWLVARGEGRVWLTFAPDKVHKAWYERPLTIPAAWAGRSTVLELDRVSTDAVVFLDGVECGRVGWSCGEVDLTKAAKPGTAQTLRILVAAIADKSESISFQGVGAGQLSTVKKEIGSKGLIGEVFLHARPTGAHVSDVFVQTSVRKHELAAAVEISGLEKAGTVEIGGRVLGPDGTVALNLPAQRVEAAAGTATLTVTWPWADPILWDISSPRLCRLALEVKSTGLDDTYEQEFGFREFWIDGRRFILNGTEIRLRPQLIGESDSLAGNIQAMDGNIAGAKQAGYNFLEAWPYWTEDRGQLHFRRLWLERCDRAGMLMNSNAGYLNQYSIDFSNWSFMWDRPTGRTAWLPEATREVRRYRNHPSLAMWSVASNYFTSHNQDQNPAIIGTRGWMPSSNQCMGVVEDAVKTIKGMDPTRPCYTHQGGYAGDVFTINHYLCMTPLQEREEWLSSWAASGVMPYIGIEFGMPLAEATFKRGRAECGQAMHSEPWATEFTAIYFGTDAYRREPASYRADIRAQFQGDQKYNFNRSADAMVLPAVQDLLSLFTRNTWRSWRAQGVTGGMLPWSDGNGWIERNRNEIAAAPFTPGLRGTWTPRIRTSDIYRYQEKSGIEALPAAKTLMAVNGETLAWIGGAAQEGDNAAFTAKDHSYRAGEELRKQAVLTNDARREQAWKLSWTLEVGGAPVAKGEDHGTLAPATNVFAPIAARLPAQLASAKVDGRLLLTVEIGADKHADVFTFRVFAPAAPVQATVLVHDPEGASAKLLTALGAKTTPWDGKPADALLVVGRRALANDLPGDLAAFARAGGRVLVMGQDPELLRSQTGARVARHLSRRVFPVASAHPVLAGLDAEDLRDWRGASALVAAKPQLSAEEFPREQPYGWHWGNRGAVSSAAIEKPHTAGWRPILECEFDLAYSPLMELDLGRGRIIWCQLDLEDHTAADPAADLLARRLLAYAASAKPIVRARTVLVADAAGTALVDGLGLRYERAATVPAEAVLAVVGAGVDDAQIQACLAAGGTVVALPRRSAQGPLGIRLAESASIGSLEAPAWPEAAGLSASDLRWRVEGKAWLIEDGCEIAADGQLGRKVVGKGRLVVCQLDPDRFDVAKETFLRFTRWRQTRALAQVLADCGAAFAADERLLHPVRVEVLSLAGEWKAKPTALVPGAKGLDTSPVDNGLSDAAKAAVLPQCDDSAWEAVRLPVMYGPFEASDGEAVFRRTVDIPASLAGKDLVLELGGIDDFDDTFWNGELVGRTDKTVPNFFTVKRVYQIPGRLVKAGKQVIAVRAFDHFGGGGFGGVSADMQLKPREVQVQAPLYHPDWRNDFDLGDDPYRYKRW